MTDDDIDAANDPRHPSLPRPDARASRRTLTLCALGALLGIAMSGYSLFTSKGTRTSVVPAEDVALVNGAPLLMTDFLEQLRALYDVSLTDATKVQKDQVLAGMIREELYVQRGLELALQSDVVEVRAALVGAVEAQATIESNVVPPTDDALRAFYEANSERYSEAGTMTLHEYLADNRPSDETMMAMRHSQPSPERAATLGLVSSGRVDDGEEYYFAARLHLGTPLFEIAREMRAGQVSDPIQLNGKWHVLVMLQNNPPVPVPLEKVADRVRNDYATSEAKRLQQRTEEFLRERADIRYQKGFQ